MIASTGPFASIDPALYDGAEPPQFGGLTYDTLVTFDHTGGVDGLRLVPDLALTLPTPTDGGERTVSSSTRDPLLQRDSGACW